MRENGLSPTQIKDLTGHSRTTIEKYTKGIKVIKEALKDQDLSNLTVGEAYNLGLIGVYPIDGILDDAKKRDKIIIPTGQTIGAAVYGVSKAFDEDLPLNWRLKFGGEGALTLYGVAATAYHNIKGLQREEERCKKREKSET